MIYVSFRLHWGDDSAVSAELRAAAFPHNFLDGADDKSPGQHSENDYDCDDSKRPREAAGFANQNTCHGRRNDSCKVGKTVLKAGPTANGVNSGERLRKRKDAHATNA